MNNVEYLFCLENEYAGALDINALEFDFKEIEAFVPKILDRLLEKTEISERACFSGFEFNSLSFDILFIDDEKIQEINRDYRAKDCPTDVITFALFADDDFKPVLDGDINLGEILISLDTAKMQAKSSLRDEILTLICHGVLHLFGFDHMTEEDYNFIVSIQDEVLSSILAV